MDKDDDYRRYAAEAQALSDKCISEVDKQAWLRIAQSWCSLSSDRHKAEVYRNYAAKCRQQSEKAAGEDRALWLKIANEWLRMADAADRNPDACGGPTSAALN